MYSNNLSLFIATLEEKISKHKPEYILYRDKENRNYDKFADDFVITCGFFENTKSFLHQNVELAKKLGAQGVHLTSLQFDEITYAKSLGLEVIISTHSHEEVLKAESLGADAVTYSPIFHSPNKGEPKGVEDLKKIIEESKINIFALGGIVENEQLRAIENVKPFGFASIRYFY